MKLVWAPVLLASVVSWRVVLWHWIETGSDFLTQNCIFFLKKWKQYQIPASIYV
jgi:hypothetical protein